MTSPPGKSEGATTPRFHEEDGADPDPPPVRLDGLDTEVLVESDGWPDAADLRRIVEQSLGAALPLIAGPLPQGATCSIVFTSDAAVRDLNATWRGKDSPTNVLSFPAAAAPSCDGRPLGDVVLGRDYVANEAQASGIPIDHHIGHLVLHGFLHLLGYDHEDADEAVRMERLESEALSRIGIADPYENGDWPEAGE